MSEPDASETPEDPDEAAVDGEDATETAPESDATLEEIAAEADLEADVGDELLGRVEETDPEQLANEVASLRLRVESLETELEERDEEVDDLESKLKRTQADFQNYKKRMKKRREQEKQRATEDLVERLLDVRDNLQRALEQDEDADIRDGVEATLRQFDDELERENVEIVEPEPGEDVDPQRHEVLLRVESEESEGTVAEVHRPGYEMADRVLREAQVTVSEGGGETESDDAGEDDDEDTAEATEDEERTAQGDADE